MNAALIPFVFKEVRLKEACWINGDPYFTGRGIGEFLEYAYPQEAVDRIVQRNPHINEFSTTVRLMVADQYSEGHSQVNLTCECLEPKDLSKTPVTEKLTVRTREIETRVYDPIGLQLIINKSNQPRALEFQIAVAQLVLAYSKGQLQMPPPSLALVAAQRPYIAGNGAAIRTIAKTEKRFVGPEGSPPVSDSTVRRRITRLRNGEPLNKRLPGLTRPYVNKKHHGKPEEALALRAKGVHISEIVRQTGVEQSTLYRWFNKHESMN